jgi:hypothetical protein
MCSTCNPGDFVKMCAEKKHRKIADKSFDRYNIDNAYY